MSNKHGYVHNRPPDDAAPKPLYRAGHGPDHRDVRDEIGYLFEKTHTVRFAARDVIYREGASASTAFVVRSGLVKLISYLANGRARIVRLHGPGSLLGVSGVVDPVYEHTAVAIDDVEVACIPIGRLARLRTEDPRSYALITESWYRDLCDADTWITEFSTGSIKARVARLVNYLSALTDSEEQMESVALLTCDEMAAVLGVTPESVSRVLAEFKRNDLLHSNLDGRGGSYECDVSALEAIAED